MAYAQTDPAWGKTTLGNSGLAMEHFGCLVTAVAQSLTDAGYEVNPGTLVNGLNASAGFTPDGLMIWQKVCDLYPQFHLDGTGVTYKQGTWGKFLHWVLEDSKGTTNPWDGSEGISGFTQISSRTVGIDPYVAPTAEVTELEPAPEVAPEQPSFPEYTVQSGDTLGHIIAQHYGLDSWAEICTKLSLVCEVNGISNPNLIHPGDVIKLP